MPPKTFNAKNILSSTMIFFAYSEFLYFFAQDNSKATRHSLTGLGTEFSNNSTNAYLIVFAPTLVSGRCETYTHTLHIGLPLRQCFEQQQILYVKQRLRANCQQN